MKRINLQKHGFLRSKLDDFTDDGTKFQVFYYKKFTVTKAYYKDQVFISARPDAYKDGLGYSEYSKLPHYRVLDRLNGVPRDLVTDEDIIQLRTDLDSFYHEYMTLLCKKNLDIGFVGP